MLCINSVLVSSSDPHSMVYTTHLTTSIVFHKGRLMYIYLTVVSKLCCDCWLREAAHRMPTKGL